MLYLIGLGLCDEGDTPLKAVEALKDCNEIYAELYTSPWHGDFGKLEKITGKKITVLPREKVESDFLIKAAANISVALLIPGDPLSATTHIDLLLRAKEAGVEVRVIHASSVYTAIAESGLQLYKFGRTTTLAWPKPGFEPTSPYEIIGENLKAGLHTLVLLDISEKPMKIGDGLKILLDIESKMKKNIIENKTKMIACAALGSPRQIIKYDAMENILKSKIDVVPACIIVPGKLNFQEEEALKVLAR